MDSGWFDRSNDDDWITGLVGAAWRDCERDLVKNGWQRRKRSAKELRRNQWITWVVIGVFVAAVAGLSALSHPEPRERRRWYEPTADEAWPPSTSEPLGDSGRTSTSEQPGDSGRPSTSEQPGDSGRPSTSEQPGDSGRPSTSEQLGDTWKPWTSERLDPEATEDQLRQVGRGTMQGTVDLRDEQAGRLAATRYLNEHHIRADHLGPEGARAYQVLAAAEVRDAQGTVIGRWADGLIPIAAYPARLAEAEQKLQHLGAPGG